MGTGPTGPTGPTGIMPVSVSGPISPFVLTPVDFPAVFTGTFAEVEGPTGATGPVAPSFTG